MLFIALLHVKEVIQEFNHVFIVHKTTESFRDVYRYLVLYPLSLAIQYSMDLVIVNKCMSTSRHLVATFKYCNVLENLSEEVTCLGTNVSETW